MKFATLRNLLTTNLVLKVISSILGFSVWLLLSYNQLQELTYHVPICFYGSRAISCAEPTHVQVTLQGAKRAFAAFDPASLAVHVCTDELKDGASHVQITPNQLFLPATLSMVHCNPRVINVS